MSYTILTGLRANNNLHLGSYTGALKPFIDFSLNSSREDNFYMFVPDLHTLTTEIDYANLKNQIINNIKTYIACGLDINQKNIKIYRQSYISAHSELTWILDCFANFGELSRMTQFKDKSKKNQTTTVGLFNYPVLMAADILLYKANYIPVGEDQTQHLEFARDLAMRFNNKFGDVFVIPEETDKQIKYFKLDSGRRIKDLQNPSIKMSKSSESSKGIIFLMDSPEDVKKKIMASTTDNYKSIKYDPINQPGISNLIEICSLVENISIKEVLNNIKDMANYQIFKEQVANSVNNLLFKIQSRFKDINDQDLIKIIQKNEQEVSLIANQTLNQVQVAVGLR